MGLRYVNKNSIDRKRTRRCVSPRHAKLESNSKWDNAGRYSRIAEATIAPRERLYASLPMRALRSTYKMHPMRNRCKDFSFCSEDGWAPSRRLGQNRVPWPLPSTSQCPILWLL